MIIGSKYHIKRPESFFWKQCVGEEMRLEQPEQQEQQEQQQRFSLSSSYKIIQNDQINQINVHKLFGLPLCSFRYHEV